MKDKYRQELALRAIRVSAMAALRQKHDDEVERRRIIERADELLAALQHEVINDGADIEVITRVERARRELRDWGETYAPRDTLGEEN